MLRPKSTLKGGIIPLISHQNNNNGVAKYIKKLDNRILFDHKTTISLADRGVFCAFTQSQDFHIGTRVKALIFKNKNVSKEVRLFFVVAINMSQVKFIEYAQNATDKLPDLQILLPVLPPDSTKAESVNDKYNIDFAFMESFIKEIEKEHFLSLIEYYHKEMSAYNEVIETNGGGALSFKLEEYLSFYESYKTTQAHSTQLQWQEVKTLDLFSVKSNPQLNKDSFVFKQNAPYPYFTRTCLNNGISGYVEYLDEEHKIKGEAIAVGMLGMQFFYMEKDFYAGQFTKSIYPKFTHPFNAKIALYFIAQLNKKQRIFQGVLVRDFEKTFYKQSVLLPLYENGEIAFEYIESFIKALQKELIKELVLWNEKELKVSKELIQKL